MNQKPNLKNLDLLGIGGVKTEVSQLAKESIVLKKFSAATQKEPLITVGKKWEQVWYFHEPKQGSNRSADNPYNSKLFPEVTKHGASRLSG